MSFEIVTEVNPEYVRVIASGEYSFNKLFDFIDTVRSTANTTGRASVLIDCRLIEGNMTEAERFQGGERIAQVFGSRLKAAIIMPAGQVAKLGELTAVNRGARLLVTESESEAAKWLLGT